MDTHQETFKTWDKIAQLYQDKFMDLDLYNDTYDTFCELIPKVNPDILEIGCGPGNITKYLLNKRPDVKITAMDISPNMIELAKLNNPEANFRVLDARNVDQLETKFEAIICGFCLPYLSKSEITKFIKDCKNLISENGILYLSFVEGDYNKSTYQTASSGDRMYFYYHSLEELKHELIENNFQTIKLFHKNYKKQDGTDEVHSIIISKRQF